ncbi:MAG TPA: RsmE family RNA methyltransferase [Candidatus Marinimicrobia bacterium]|jgi:16S rRNA (uracil1498-N3)-methyltransferase|nr:hypothetical protein [Candidatus Neomarinimicrobiota bacterium]MDP7217669.1 RsmE family RNA methyltransferase [Candidatus Neomarinimicrobiota bacterium]MDP7436657.1 RsmE family RNA methyltransferase [Candidatus Neomarinimicrobiota bacterium]MDP7653733.1 RsmE family RNA methyltransferase [Candidatus Neomarinimicrobiota bacterium]HBN45412.1 hypothetical protein [Candidatus Neomarinimicrobiota bacterium]|tara:strand:- start:9767 stop:10471 length:705 start_codon:yes stop_codon:yes gene_type:complete
MAGEHFFYISPNQITGNRFTLDTGEGHHAVNVLRLQVDDEIWLVDGVGTAYKGIITENGRSVTGDILERIPNHAEARITMHLAVGLIKRDRFEWLLEKAVECGAASITPLILDKCVKKSLNMERSQKIVQAAAKQCGRSLFPGLHEPTTLDNYLRDRPGVTICLQNTGDIGLANWQMEQSLREVSVMIGPEGDFSENEMDVIRNNYIDIVTLGSRRLRTETAAITALNIIEYGG